MKFLKFITALFLFISCLSLFSQDYLIRVDFDEYKLFLINDAGIVVAAYPVAVPSFKPNYLPAYGAVTKIDKKPRWYPTEKTRRHYIEVYGIELPKVVESDDPLNAMGAVQIVIKFDSSNVNPLYRIHGTNDESSIGTKATSGCIRMYNKDILKLVGVIDGKQVRVLFER
jgi:lipoprotein-anchoring transpeptidase ErfK/SrfK